MSEQEWREELEYEQELRDRRARYEQEMEEQDALYRERQDAYVDYLTSLEF